MFNKCDVLHLPGINIPVPTIAETDVADGPGMAEMLAQTTHCTRPINYLGLPAVSVPAGFTGNGLPAAFQLVGRLYAEAQLLRTANAYEQATGWTAKAPDRCSR